MGQCFSTDEHDERPHYLRGCPTSPNRVEVFGESSQELDESMDYQQKSHSPFMSENRSFSCNPDKSSEENSNRTLFPSNPGVSFVEPSYGEEHAAGIIPQMQSQEDTELQFVMGPAAYVFTAGNVEHQAESVANVPNVHESVDEPAEPVANRPNIDDLEQQDNTTETLATARTQDENAVPDSTASLRESSYEVFLMFKKEQLNQILINTCEQDFRTCAIEEILGLIGFLYDIVCNPLGSFLKEYPSEFLHCLEIGMDKLQKIQADVTAYVELITCHLQSRQMRDQLQVCLAIITEISHETSAIYELKNSEFSALETNDTLISAQRLATVDSVECAIDTTAAPLEGQETSVFNCDTVLQFLGGSSEVQIFETAAFEEVGDAGNLTSNLEEMENVAWIINSCDSSVPESGELNNVQQGDPSDLVGSVMLPPSSQQEEWDNNWHNAEVVGHINPTHSDVSPDSLFVDMGLELLQSDFDVQRNSDNEIPSRSNVSLDLEESMLDI